MEEIKEYECACEHCECEIDDYVAEMERVSDKYDGLDYDADLFIDGFDSVTKLAGQIVGLTRTGLSFEEVIQLITLQNSLELEREVREHELKLAKINSNTTIKCEEIKSQSLEISNLCE